MIVHDVPQGSPEWFERRLALPTASCFHRILTPTLKPATGMKTYAYELIAEALIGEQADSGGGEFMARGTEMEPEAVAWYELHRDVDTQTVGFCTTDDGEVGCSPDRLVGDDGLLEIKCPSAKVFVATMMGENEHAHRCQVQGQMWVTGREWCDLVIYNPVLPPMVTRHTVDPEWVAAFESALATFQGILVSGAVKLRDLGIEPEFRPDWWPEDEPNYGALDAPGPVVPEPVEDKSQGIADMVRKQREARKGER